MNRCIGDKRLILIVMKCYDQKPLKLISNNQTHGGLK